MCFSVYPNRLQKGTSGGWKHDKLAGSEYRRGGIMGFGVGLPTLLFPHPRECFLGTVTLHVLIQRKTISSHKLG